MIMAVEWTPLFLMYFMCLSSSTSKNPVKMAFFLMISSMLMFFSMMVKTGSIWFPMLFLLVFMGGILMMFMILSSIMPNEHASQKNTSKILMAFLMTTFVMSASVKPLIQIKEILTSGLILTTMILFMTLYFIPSVSMISESSSPLRSSLT